MLLAGRAFEKIDGPHLMNSTQNHGFSKQNPDLFGHEMLLVSKMHKVDALWA